MHISAKQPRTWLTKSSGFLEDYTHSLNPYMGCVYGCSYCYVRQMPIGLFAEHDWGTWVTGKQFDSTAFRREWERTNKKGPTQIFMSSSTDPYQPLEHRMQITRKILEVFVEVPPDFVLIQTRSPLVTRDLDLLSALKNHVRVSMTIETDLEDVRRAITPQAPPLPLRFRALEQIHDAEIPCQATVAPALPYSDTFPHRLRPLVEKVCIDDFFAGDGAGGKRSKALGMGQKLSELGYADWFAPEMMEHVVKDFRSVFTDEELRTNKRGFAPSWH